MKILILLLVILFSCSLVFGENVNLGGFYIPTTKTYSTAGTASGSIVWTPTSGKAIVLMGAFLSTSPLGSIHPDTTIRLGTGINSSGNGTFVDVIPATGIASGPIVIGTGVPIWEGAVNGTLSITTSKSITPAISLWGYEH